VLFDGTGARRVRGVEVEHRGRTEVVRAERVVLSSGAIGTLGLLLRSGIGPRDDVARLGVELTAHVPGVGARLLDHPGSALIFAARPGVSSSSHPLIQTLLRWTSERSSFVGDMQVQPGSTLPLPWLTVPTVTMMCCIGKPRGAGRVVFRSVDPLERPIIESDLLTDPHDLDKAVQGVELAFRCARTKAMRGLAWPFWPAPSALRDRDGIRGWIFRGSGSGYHPCGTVPMGPDGDAMAATDQWGRVRGVEGLLVADASLMPTIPSSNLHVPTLMMGERFGEWLRDGGLD
jgi:choline dehydrogenase